MFLTLGAAILLLLSTVQVASSKKPSLAEGFTFPSFSSVVAELHSLEENYPDLVEVFSAQQRYGLQDVEGECDGLPCQHWFIRLGNKKVVDRLRPQVVFSGNIHGNEVVGPVTLMEWITTMLSEYKEGNPYAQLMLNTRWIVIIPVTNPWGYTRRQREETGIDPNRDFPYNRIDSRCMESITARALNEVYRDNLFQLGITFHGGMVAIAYEWGSFNHYNSPRLRRCSSGTCNESPDHAAQHSMADTMALFGGGRYGRRRPYYSTAPMNDLVYPVNGGMEDWAYASSWESSAVTTCQPHSSDYPAEKTQYNPAMLRCINTLVETSDAKIPFENTLGNVGVNCFLMHRSSLRSLPVPSGVRENLWSAESDGHVPRNMRLVWVYTDLVEPYVVWQRVTPTTPVSANLRGRSLRAAEGYTPWVGTKGQLQAWTENDALQYDLVLQPKDVHVVKGYNAVALDLAWDVGGAITVDGTFALVFPWPKEVSKDSFSQCISNWRGNPSRTNNKEESDGTALCDPPSSIAGDNQKVQHWRDLERFLKYGEIPGGNATSLLHSHSLHGGTRSAHHSCLSLSFVTLSCIQMEPG